MPEKRKFISLVYLLTLMVWASTTVPAMAEDRIKPYVLAEITNERLGVVTDRVVGQLVANGFEVVGGHAPDEGVMVFAITRDDLLARAAKTERGAYGAVMRVGVAKTKAGVQVSFVNPRYLAHAYRLVDDLSDVAEDLATALGSERTFGGEGLTAETLQDYHYGFGMEYFDDPYRLGKFGSHAEAVETVEAGLADHLSGAEKVYRLEIPGRDQVLFGIALDPEKGADPDASAAEQLKAVDFRELKRQAYLPYEILVDGSRVEALHMRFRMAVHFPDLNMMGEHSFMKLRRSPEATRSAFMELIGKEPVDTRGVDPLEF